MPSTGGKGDSERLLGSPELCHPSALSAIHMADADLPSLLTPHDEPPAALKRSRLLAAVALPLLMIVLTMLIEKEHVADAAAREPRDAREAAAAQSLSNAALLNRTCAPPLLLSLRLARAPHGRARAPLEGAERLRVLIGAGFPASGLSAVAPLLARLPGACSPARASLGFWTTLGGGTPPHSAAGRRVDAEEEEENPAAPPAWRLPAKSTTREHYLRDVLRLDERKCSVPWEISERYSSIAFRHFSPPAICTPLTIRHYLPSARILLMLAAPVRRAHAQQTAWLHNRCYRDGREAAAAKRGAKYRMAKGAAAGCDRFTAEEQLRLELNCMHFCGLSPSSPMEELLRCATVCSKSLRTALGCKANCPYPSLINSHYALVLSIWLHAFSCDQLLILDQDEFFGSSAETPHRLVGSAAVSALPPTNELQPLLAILRLASFSMENATRLAQSPAFHDRPTAPNFGTALNPISASLRRELDAYFEPFQESLRQLLATHRKCFHERFAAKKSKQKTKMVAR
ncbi:hypothetical protein AB1Y20_013215 [Prymnesium parvum]|uniref:Uncharacterized protein n=1 Tax=Prymnesium parvum TaxID=97485 RepID=A0AB34IKZ1_PRYPA